MKYVQILREIPKVELLVSADRWSWILHYKCKFQRDEPMTLYSNVQHTRIGMKSDSMVRHHIGPKCIQLYCIDMYSTIHEK